MCSVIVLSTCMTRKNQFLARWYYSPEYSGNQTRKLKLFIGIKVDYYDNEVN